MACGCEKRRERLAAQKKVVVASGNGNQQAALAGPSIWHGKPAEKQEATDG